MDEKNEYYEMIFSELVRNLQNKLDNKEPTYSSILMFYMHSSTESPDEAEKIRNYGDDTDGVSFYVSPEIGITPPFTPMTNATLIRTNNIKRVPMVVASIEKIVKNYSEKMDDFFIQFKKQKVNPLDNDTYIIRLESYDIIKRKKYIVKDSKLELVKEMESDGKMFLPYLN